MVAAPTAVDISEGFGGQVLSTNNKLAWPAMIFISALNPHPFTLMRQMGVTDKGMADFYLMTGICSEN